MDIKAWRITTNQNVVNNTTNITNLTGEVGELKVVESDVTSAYIAADELVESSLVSVINALKVRVVALEGDLYKPQIYACGIFLFDGQEAVDGKNSIYILVGGGRQAKTGLISSIRNAAQRA